MPVGVSLMVAPSPCEGRPHLNEGAELAAGGTLSTDGGTGLQSLIAEMGWQPATADEVARAAAQGLLQEGHHLDIKRERAGGPSQNKEAAKDMASFAVDGGLLVYGVDESKAPPSATPILLTGLPERLEQIALAAVTEPLFVRTMVLPKSADPTRGFVVVVVPPSGRAPHMVDGRYYGRGDKTKIVLSDAQVSAMHEQRVMRERATQGLAQADLEDAPVPSTDGVLALVARPLAAHTPLLEELSTSCDWKQRSLALLMRVAGAEAPYAPQLRHATSVARQPHGIRLSAGLDRARQVSSEGDVERNRRRVVELRLDEDGTLHLLSARAVEVRDGWPLIFEQLIVGNARHLVALCREVAALTGYQGGWHLCLSVDGLQGGISLVLSSAFQNGHVYTKQTYERATTASAEELRACPDGVVARLVGPLLRALGSERLPDFQGLLP